MDELVYVLDVVVWALPYWLGAFWDVVELYVVNTDYGWVTELKESLIFFERVVVAVRFVSASFALAVFCLSNLPVCITDFDFMMRGVWTKDLDLLRYCVVDVYSLPLMKVLVVVVVTVVIVYCRLAIVEEVFTLSLEVLLVERGGYFVWKVSGFEETRDERPVLYPKATSFPIVIDGAGDLFRFLPL